MVAVSCNAIIVMSSVKVAKTLSLAVRGQLYIVCKVWDQVGITYGIPNFIDATSINFSIFHLNILLKVL